MSTINAPRAIALAVCQRVAELPDRNSPEDWPEAMLVTGPELIDAVADEIEQTLAMEAPALEAPAAPDLRKTRDKAGILHYLTPEQMAEEIVRLDAMLAVAPQAPAAPAEPVTAGGAYAEMPAPVAHSLGLAKYAHSSNIIAANEFTPDAEHADEWESLVTTDQAMAFADETHALRTALAAPAAPSASTLPDAAYCALQYVEHTLAAIANREEQLADAIHPVDTIGKASKRAKAALTRLQAVAHHFDAAAPAAPSGDGLREQHDRDSAELRRLCQARDEARRERDLARAEIAGLQASTGHLSALVDAQHALLEQAKATMTALHGSASPIDESGGDFDARIPASAFTRFVDEHAALLYALAQSPVAAPAAPAVDATNDTARMDWLETQVVNVRAPLRYGSRDMFWASPEEVDGGPDGPSDLRARIDAAQAAAKGTP